MTLQVGIICNPDKSFTITLYANGAPAFHLVELSAAEVLDYELTAFAGRPMELAFVQSFVKSRPGPGVHVVQWLGPETGVSLLLKAAQLIEDSGHPLPKLVCA